MTTASHGVVGIADFSESGPRIEERRERQRQEARRTILDATEALMIEANGSSFSIRKLGDRSGYSAPTVYHYFGDKDGLIDALLDDRVGRLADELEQVDPNADPRERLRAILLAYFEFSVSNPTFTRLMWTVSGKGRAACRPRWSGSGAASRRVSPASARAGLRAASTRAARAASSGRSCTASSRCS